MPISYATSPEKARDFVLKAQEQAQKDFKENKKYQKFSETMQLKKEVINIRS